MSFHRVIYRYTDSVTICSNMINSWRFNKNARNRICIPIISADLTSFSEYLRQPLTYLAYITIMVDVSHCGVYTHKYTSSVPVSPFSLLPFHTAHLIDNTHTL
jgi:hypothetical protein